MIVCIQHAASPESSAAGSVLGFDLSFLQVHQTTFRKKTFLPTENFVLQAQDYFTLQVFKVEVGPPRGTPWTRPVHVTEMARHPCLLVLGAWP